MCALGINLSSTVVPNVLCVRIPLLVSATWCTVIVCFVTYHSSLWSLTQGIDLVGVNEGVRIVRVRTAGHAICSP